MSPCSMHCQKNIKTGSIDRRFKKNKQKKTNKTSGGQWIELFNFSHTVKVNIVEILQKYKCYEM